KAIGTDRVILSWLAYGVPIRVAAEPSKWKFRNHRSALEQFKFVRKEIEQHLADQCFEVVDANGVAVVNPLQVEPKGESDWRLCTDMRFINAFLAHPVFRLETLKG